MLWVIFLLPSVIRSLCTSLFLVLVEKHLQMNSGDMFPCCYFDGRNLHLVCHLTLFVTFDRLTIALTSIFVLVKIRPKLKCQYKSQVQAAYDYSKTIKDFNNFIDPRTLYQYFLGHEPSLFVLKEISREEKSRWTSIFFFLFV